MTLDCPTPFLTAWLSSAGTMTASTSQTPLSETANLPRSDAMSLGALGGLPW